MEVINYLVGYEGMKIVQNTEYFNFSLDSVYLLTSLLFDLKLKTSLI